MGQKVNPNSFRIGTTKGWLSNWVSPDKKSFAQNLEEDAKIRNYLLKKISKELLGTIIIQRTLKIVTVTLQTPRPALVIGNEGKSIDQYTADLKKICGKDIQLNVRQIRKSDLNAKIVAEALAAKVSSKSVNYKRVVLQAVGNTTKMGALGVKVQISGRLGGAEIARSETIKEGRVPLQTMRADIDYAEAQALTTYGIIGIKVWIYLGAVYGKRDFSLQLETIPTHRGGKKRIFNKNR